MELRQIQYFLAVVDNRSFAQASATLGVAQPALSRQVRLVQAFSSSYPQVRLHVVDGFSGFVNEWLVSGRIDMAVLNEARRSPNIRCDRLMSADLFLLGAAHCVATLAAGSSSIAFSELLGVPLVLPGRNHGLRRELDMAARELGLDLTIRVEIDALAALKKLVRHGLGVTILPRADRWLLALQFDPGRGERLEDFDEARTTELVRRASGSSDTRVKLFDAREWSVAAYIADRFMDRRIFLLGDAAHSMPPTGGFGGNTGIQDAHNLAWKLALVLGGTARSELLDTYDAERRFVAERVLRQALARLSAWFKDSSNRLPPPDPIEDDAPVIFGYRYPRGALLPEEPDDRAFEDPRHPSARPGSRAPHFLVEHAGVRMPVHDLFPGRFTLLTGPDGAAWCEAARHAAVRRKFDMQCLRIGETNGRFLALYGIGASGASLVRPDGFIAWRAAGEVGDPVAALADILERLGLAG